jgi:two-component system, chemotaxis family, chemotaxis protein CheY
LSEYCAREPLIALSAMDVKAQKIKTLLGLIKVVVVDDEHYSRKVIRTLLNAIGVTTIHETSDGADGLQAIEAFRPEIVLLDWEMPGMDGAEFMRRVRSPATFKYPDTPIIMLTGHGERSRVVEAVKLGVHEFLLKPVSSAALRTRILSVLTMPRPMVRRGDFYGPEPRKLSTYKPEIDPGIDPHEVGGESAPTPRPNFMIFVN